MRDFIIIILANLIPLALISQVDDNSQISDTVVVTKNLKINKTEISPYLLEYSGADDNTGNAINTTVVPPEEVDLNYPDPPLNINPIRYTHRREKAGRDGLIKLGYGIPNALDGQVLYDYHIEDWYHIGVKGGFSTARDTSRQDMRYNALDIGIFGGYWVTPNFNVSLDTDFSRINQSLYGERSEFLPGGAPIRHIQSIDNRIGYNLSKYTSIGLQVDGVLRYEATELVDEVDQQNYLSADLHIAKTIWNGISLDVTGKAETASVLDSNNVNNYSLNPALRYSIEDLHLEAGLYSTFSNEETFFWPKVLAQYTLTDAPVTLELRTMQSPHITTLKSIVDINPFINTNDTIPTQLSVTRDVKLSAAYTTNDLIITPSYTYQLADNQLLYERSNVGFEIIDFDQISSHQVGLDLDYSLQDWGGIQLYGRAYFYSSFVDAFTTYLPLFEVKVAANQALFNDRLLLKQGLLYRQVTDSIELEETVIFGAFNPNIVDLSASINFKLFPKFWIYAEGSNLLFQDYTIWQGHGVFQPKVLFGLKYLIGQ